MKTKVVTTEEIYNCIKCGDIFYLIKDEDGNIDITFKFLVIDVKRYQYKIEVLSVRENGCVITDKWYKSDAINLSQDRLIQLIYD